jgi:hypothetical protein
MLVGVRGTHSRWHYGNDFSLTRCRCSRNDQVEDDPRSFLRRCPCRAKRLRGIDGSTRERPPTGRWRAAKRQLRREGPRCASVEGETCVKNERSELLERMSQRRRLGRPAGKLNRSEAEEKRSPVPPPLMLFTLFPADSSFSEESASNLGLYQGTRMTHHHHQRHRFVRRQPGRG